MELPQKSILLLLLVVVFNLLSHIDAHVTGCKYEDKGKDDECDDQTYTKWVTLALKRSISDLGCHPTTYVTKKCDDYSVSLPNRALQNPCGENARMCSSIQTCVALSRVCDGQNDCGDNSDEVGCAQTTGNLGCEYSLKGFDGPCDTVTNVKEVTLVLRGNRNDPNCPLSKMERKACNDFSITKEVRKKQSHGCVYEEKGIDGECNHHSNLKWVTLKKIRTTSDKGCWPTKDVHRQCDDFSITKTKKDMKGMKYGPGCKYSPKGADRRCDMDTYTKRVILDLKGQRNDPDCYLTKVEVVACDDFSISRKSKKKTGKGCAYEPKGIDGTCDKKTGYKYVTFLKINARSKKGCWPTKDVKVLCDDFSQTKGYYEAPNRQTGPSPQMGQSVPGGRPRGCKYEGMGTDSICDDSKNTKWVTLKLKPSLSDAGCHPTTFVTKHCDDYSISLPTPNVG